MQISRISSKDDRFPDMLSEMEIVPESINILGELPKGVYISIVGSRTPTAYGQQITYQLASELARSGAIIVSGLALGIDGIAHQAALEAGGKTVAVLAHGLTQIYPREHRNLAKEILARGGALISEYEVGIPPMKHRFIERNRIIAGLSVATIVTECSVTSGALFTAKAALDNGRTLFAVPGPITAPFSAGPNNLFRAGAIPVSSSTDILTQLGYEARETVPVPAQSPDEAAIARLLEAGVSNSEDLIQQSQLSAAQFANIISLMEITGKVRNLGAGRWMRR